MATSAQISVDEYLRTTYRPDCDYVDGELEERNVGELDHGLIQIRLGAYFLNPLSETGLLPVTELRIRLTSGKFRIPDVVVVQGKPDEQVLTKPPLLCIEILSKDDTIPRMNKRIQEYLDFGVPAVWLVSPAEKSIWIYRAHGMQEAQGESVRLDGTEIEIPFSAIFD